MGFYLLSYLCLAVFVLAVLWRVVRQWRLPVHVRWELYPVQHERPARAAYGGSYLEEVNWWEKPREVSLLNEARYMVPEMLFIRGLRERNPDLWRVSFPFHFGLYLLIAAFGLMVLLALLKLTGIAAGTPLRVILAGLTALAVWGGLPLGLFGGLGLLRRRLADPALRAYATPLDYLNLGLITLFFLTGLLAALGDPLLGGARGYVYGLLTGGGSWQGYLPGGSAAGAATIVLASFLAAYIPLTHMSHMFMKYFLYHRVKWDDAPNRPGSALEAAVQANLALKPTWQAPHVGADGKRSWQEIAAEPPKEMK